MDIALTTTNDGPTTTVHVTSQYYVILRNHWFTQNRTLPRRGFLHEKFDDR